MQIFGKSLARGSRAIRLKQGRLNYNLESGDRLRTVSGMVTGRPGRFEVFRAPAPQRLLVNNWQSWGPTLAMGRNERFADIARVFAKYSHYVFTPLPETFQTFLVSDYFISGEKMLVGFLSSEIAHPFFTVEGEELVRYLDYFDSFFADAVPLEPLVILEGEGPEELLERYAALLQRQYPRDSFPANPVGWCSWYQYFTHLTWDDLRHNLRLARERHPFDVFQIDDGYQADIGDWLTPRPGFPALAEMASVIRAHGFRPGIWTAPFSVSETAPLFENHPEWLVAENGRPKVCYRNWNKNIYALDTTHPQAQEWLAATFRQLAGSGFDYFKIDFLFAAAMPGQRCQALTPIQAFRQGLALIRRAAPERFVLGCGSPLLPAAGLVDGMRISEDVATFWDSRRSPIGGPNTYWSIKNTLNRYFFHRALWLNDPDCLLLRDKDIEIGADERRLYALVAGILDNMLLESDDLALVDARGRALFEQALNLRGGRVRVRGVFADDLYRIESRGSPSGDHELLVNLGERPAGAARKEPAGPQCSAGQIRKVQGSLTAWTQKKSMPISGLTSPVCAPS